LPADLLASCEHFSRLDRGPYLNPHPCIHLSLCTAAPTYTVDNSYNKKKIVNVGKSWGREEIIDAFGNK